MDLIYINDHKLKIMLSEIDMKEYALDSENLDYENRETRARFWNILNKASENTGFDFEGGKIFIQLYPSKEGGCEMYVTKIGGLSRRHDGEAPENRLAEGKRIGAYSFIRLEDLISVCRRLSSLGYSEKSSAWQTADKYYLIMTEPEENAYIPLSE
jgi:negative regulator of genetic competence, sporulation and motility